MNKATANTVKKAVHTNVKAGNLYYNANLNSTYIVYELPRNQYNEGWGEEWNGQSLFCLVSLRTGKNFLLPREDITAIFGDNSDGNGGHANFERVSSVTIDTDYEETIALS